MAVYDLPHLDPDRYAIRLAAVRRDGAPPEFAAALVHLGIITDPDWVAELVALGGYRTDLGGPIGVLETAGIAQHCRPHAASDPVDIDAVVHLLEGELARLLADTAALSGKMRPKTRLRNFVDGLAPLYAVLNGNRKTGLTEFVRASCALVVEYVPSETLLRSAVTKTNK